MNGLALCAGVYDVACTECKGQRVVLVPDEERADPEALEAWRAMQQAEWELRAAYEAERRMGA